MTNNTIQIRKILNNYNIINPEINLIRETIYNAVYKINHNKKSYVLRVGYKTYNEDVKTETELISFLFKNGFSSPEVIKNKEGKLFMCIDNITAVLFSFIEGRHVELSKDILPTPKIVFLVGKELGKFHGITKNIDIQFNKENRFKIELSRIIKNKDLFIKSFENSSSFISEIEEALRFIDESHLQNVIIHNDLRYHNVFFDESELKITGIIDYDWSCNGPAIKDVAHTALEWSFPDGAASPNMNLFNKLIEGYNSVAETKIKTDSSLYKWVIVSALSDTATYLSDKMNEPNTHEIKYKISSYMYKKAIFFKSLLSKENI